MTMDTSDPITEPVIEHSSAGAKLAGGEACLLDAAVEEQGVADIRQALTEEERNQIPHADMPIRHFRAVKGNLQKAIDSVKHTLKWRQEFGVDAIVQCMFETDGEHQELKEILEQENATGKIYSRGYDAQGRALMYMRPARENTNNELNNMRHLVWNLEKAIACTRAKSTAATGKERTKINLMIDYEGFRLRDSPPLSTSKYTLEILQKHYPEIMFHAYILNPPMVFRTFWMIVRPFVDPITKEKIVFCSGKSGIAKFVSAVSATDKLEAVAGGPAEGVRDFDSKEYMHLPFSATFDE